MTKIHLSFFSCLGCHSRVWFWLLRGLEVLQTPSTGLEPMGLWLHFPYEATSDSFRHEKFCF